MSNCLPLFLVSIKRTFWIDWWLSAGKEVSSLPRVCLVLYLVPSFVFVDEPPHDKTHKMTVRPATIQISLGIRPVWSKSSLCAQRIAKDPSFLHADSEDSDQTGRTLSLIWVFAGRKCNFVGFIMRRLISFPFGVLGRMRNSIVWLPDHCLLIKVPLYIFFEQFHTVLLRKKRKRKKQNLKLQEWCVWTKASASGSYECMICTFA